MTPKLRIWTPFARPASLGVGADVERNDRCARGYGEIDIALGDGANARVQHLDHDLVVEQLAELRAQDFDRALHVALDDQVDGALVGLSHRFEDVLADRLTVGEGHHAVGVGTLFGDFLGVRKVGTTWKRSPTPGSLSRPETDRRGRTGGLDRLAAVVLDRTNLAVAFARQDHLALLEAAVLDQKVRDDAAALLNSASRTTPEAAPWAWLLRSGSPSRKTRSSSSSAFALERRHAHHRRRTTPVLEDELERGELVHHLVGVCLGLVALVERNHDRAGGARVVDCLFGLRLHAVVGRDHQDRDIDGRRTAGPHRGERRVTGRVDHRDLVPGRGLDLVRTDVLRDAAGLALGDATGADRVNQRRLAVVDVTRDRDRRRPDRELFLVDRLALLVELSEQGLFGCDLARDFELDLESAASSTAVSSSMFELMLTPNPSMRKAVFSRSLALIASASASFLIVSGCSIWTVPPREGESTARAVTSAATAAASTAAGAALLRTVATQESTGFTLTQLGGRQAPRVHHRSATGHGACPCRRSAGRSEPADRRPSGGDETRGAAACRS